MSKVTRPDEAAPTMIIPKGTEIEVDEHGQLSVRTPGNLVIQNSGQYGYLESLTGSIRIESGVEVEAVSVRCPETCYVEGNLTAWKLAAKNLHLEDTAKAHIVLQETERMEVGRGARLVGNFSSEKELFFLFSRFSKQVRNMPLYRDQDEERGVKQLPEAKDVGPGSSLPLLAEGDLTASMDLPDPLFFALVLLERDLRQGQYGDESRRVLKELVNLLREPDLETLKSTYKTLFGRISAGSDKVQRAQELVGDHFRRGAAG
jgi:hypothetical protein